jgi:benzoyl-CoA reductase/2-hydroxyglutaryl-CoA dehydratase subunit BcrC/BadD/HgdB
MAAALASHRAGTPVVGVTSNTVPVEMIRAAGGFPIVVRSDRPVTPLADEYMEPGVFQPRIRRIFDAVASGEWSWLAGLVIPRTSEQEYKLFLYLQELTRTGHRGLPPIHLFDLLHARTPGSDAYNRDRTAHLARALGDMTGQAPSRDRLADAVIEGNRVRAAVRAVGDLRRPEPRLRGVDALACIGASHLIDPGTYVETAREAVSDLARRPVLTGARIVLAGELSDTQEVHRLVEGEGAIVIAEESWWGTCAAGDEVVADDDVSGALANKYAFDALSPRVFPVQAADCWFERLATPPVDGVVFVVPAGDSVVGWDVPRRRAWLADRGMPAFVLRGGRPAEDGGRPSALATFVASLASRG